MQCNRATCTIHVTISNRFMLYFSYYMLFKNVDGAMHFIYSHKYNTNSAEDSSDMN